MLCCRQSQLERVEACEMLFPFISYPDGLHTAYEPMASDGSYHVVCEWPIDMDVASARCKVPSMEWDRAHAASREDLAELSRFVGRNRSLLDELAEEARNPDLHLQRLGLTVA